MAINLVKSKGIVTKNVRISVQSHKLLLAYCKKKGFNIGAFCEIGALDKMKSEVTPAFTSGYVNDIVESNKTPIK